MEILSGVTISDELVTLDGKHFINCTLVNCLLSYSGQSVVFERTVLRKCTHVFHGSARATVHLLQHVGLLESEIGKWQELPDQVN